MLSLFERNTNHLGGFMFFRVPLRILPSPIVAAAALIAVLALVSWSSVRATTEMGEILVDNNINTYNISISDTFLDAQGFTTGQGYYRLTGVEINIASFSTDAAISLAILEPTGAGRPGTTLYELEAPSSLTTGTVFFSAPENSYLVPNTDYLVKIDVSSGSVAFNVTGSTDESTSGLEGWSIADNIWTSSGLLQGISWTSDDSFLYAISVRGTKVPDRQGENTYTAGSLAFSRHTGESPTVTGFINDATDTDWFETSLSFDYGGRYRIDVEPLLLTNEEDIGVRAFYVDYPSDHSRDPVVEVEPVVDPPEGYKSWHFTAGRNYGPHIEVYADNGTTGRYAIRVVYDPDRIWTGTEVVRGDLPHDDTTWATITVDEEEAAVGVYHYHEDHDWYAVELEDDTVYVVVAIAAEGPYIHYMKPAIKLYDDAGTELASNYISHDDTTSRSLTLGHEVGAGEGGTYYVSVVNAELWDNPDELATLGITEPRVLYSPFLALRYHVLATIFDEDDDNRRGGRSLSGTNREPWILNRREISLPENTSLAEYITGYDFDLEDAITGYRISGGDDQELFSISSSGLLSMVATPDYEVPADANMDNRYEVQVEVTSGEGDRALSATAEFTVTVTNDETESETVLVSNTGQSVKGHLKVDKSDWAVRIYTGPSPDGYVIHGVALALAESLEDPSDLKVSLWSNHKPGRYHRPKQEIFAFTNPSSIEARLTEFTAPPDSVLEPETSYWVMIERTGEASIMFLDTASDSQDSFSELGWDIGANRLYRPRNRTGQWGYQRVKGDKDQFLLRVIGYARNGE